MPIGQHKGKRFEEIPLEDLDRLLGWIEETCADRFPDLQAEIKAYLKENHYAADQEVE